MAAPPFDLPNLPNLQRLSHVHGAAATSAQRMESKYITYPLGFGQSQTGVTRTTVPATWSALWFQELYAGYRAANFIHYPTKPSDTVPILVAEALELRTAACGAPVADGSLPARALAVWVIVGNNQAEQRDGVGSRILNALAHWASSASCPTHTMRIGIATKGAAATILQTAAREGAAHPYGPACDSPCWTLVVRWADARGDSHSAVESLGVAPLNAQVVLERVQRTLCLVLARYDLGAPPAALTLATPVPLNAFAIQSAWVDAQFALTLEAAPICVRSAAAATKGAPPLENTGIFVRVCEKKRGDDGVTHSSAFHGVLLSFGGEREDVAAFANAADPALTCPVGQDEESMGLHLCAVQAEACALATNVSLFSHVGRAGQPIHPPGSHVYRECAAIRPVDVDLLAFWDLRPCSKSSTLPEDDMYHAPYQQHFSRASKLYLSLSADPDNALQGRVRSPPRRSRSSSNSLDELAHNGACAPLNDLHQYRDDAALRLALHVDLRSRRTTVGEAYAYLFDAGMPRGLLNTMLHTIARLGVRASLDEMFRLASASLGQQARTVSVNALDETIRLKALMDVCLSALATEDANGTHASKRARPSPLVVDKPERVRRMLVALGIRRCDDAVLVKAMNDASVSKAATLVMGGIAHLLPLGQALAPEAHAMAVKAFAPCIKPPEGCTDENWVSIVDAAVARAAAVTVLRSGILGANIFLITSSSNSGAVTIQQLAVEPLLNPSSFDSLIATPMEHSCVLLVQHLAGSQRKCKITSTAPHTFVERSGAA